MAQLASVRRMKSLTGLSYSKKGSDRFDKRSMSKARRAADKWFIRDSAMSLMPDIRAEEIAAWDAEQERLDAKYGSEFDAYADCRCELCVRPDDDDVPDRSFEAQPDDWLDFMVEDMVVTSALAG